MPTAGRLRSLEELYIPGGFDDPFRIAGLVDLQALGGRREFLKDLGVQELTFLVYAQEQVPLEAIRNCLGRVVDTNDHAFYGVLFHASLKSARGKANEPKPWVVNLGAPHLAPNS